MYRKGILCCQVRIDFDFKHHINQYILSTWQDDWNGAVTNKLHSVKLVLGNWQSSYRLCRKDKTVLCRARIGHTHLTHSYILKKDPPPKCEHCQCNVTVCHSVSNTFWWSTIILLKEKRKYICVVKEMWRNHLESTPHSFYYI